MIVSGDKSMASSSPGNWQPLSHEEQTRHEALFFSQGPIEGLLPGMLINRSVEKKRIGGGMIGVNQCCPKSVLYGGCSLVNIGKYMFRQRCQWIIVSIEILFP